MPLLRQCLLDTYLVRLRAIAGFWDVELTASRQREAALDLAEAMDDAQAVARVYRALPKEERRALHALLASGGRMPQRIFARQWGDIRAMGPGRMAREQPWDNPVSPAEGLWYRGLFFRSFEQGPDGAYEAVFIPPEIEAHLPRPAAAGTHIALEPVSTPAAVFSSADLLVDDACTLLSYVQNERPRLLAGRRWPDRHKKPLVQQLRIRNPHCFIFLAHLAVSIGWLVDQDGGRLRLAPESVTAWLQSDTRHQRAALVETWRDDPTWNDLFHIPTLQPEDTGAWRNDPTLARKAVLHHLTACAPQAWYSLSDFAAAIKQADPDFQRPGGDYETWYIRDTETGDYLSGFESWDAVEGRLIRHLITQPMAWLGLVDLGSRETERQPTTFRLTAAGAAFLDLADPPPSSKPSAPRLRSGFRVSVPAARRYQRFQIARVADWLQSGDRFTYRLTPASLERARRQGIAVSRVLEFLGEACEAPIPRLLEAALTRWDARGTEAWLERAVLLRLSSEELMSQALASRPVGQLVQERLGPTTALVRQRDWSRVVAGLEEMGLLPRVTGLDEDRLTQQ
ncbi:MAG: helicase-associated domain-containing protein [Chloroflexota bacterium]